MQAWYTPTTLYLRRNAHAMKYRPVMAELHTAFTCPEYTEVWVHKRYADMNGTPHNHLWRAFKRRDGYLLQTYMLGKVTTPFKTSLGWAWGWGTPDIGPYLDTHTGLTMVVMRPIETTFDGTIPTRTMKGYCGNTKRAREYYLANGIKRARRCKVAELFGLYREL